MRKMNTSYICAVCREKFPFRQVKYSKDGKRLVCNKCYGKISDSAVKAVEKPVKEKPELIKVICVDCRYKFHLNKQSKIKVKCPYCGKDDLMLDETTADKLIQEVSQYAE